MAKNKVYYWLKLYDDLFTSKRIKKLRKLGADFFIIYLKMQLISLKRDGYIEFDGVEDSFADELALEIDEDADKIALTIAFLQANGLLECNTPNEYFLPYVAVCTGSETESAVRQRKCRAKKRAMLEGQGGDDLLPKCDNVTTMSQVGHTEKEKEIDKEIYKESSSVTIDYEDFWKKTYGLYPSNKRSNMATAKTLWMDKLLAVFEQNRMVVINDIGFAIRLFVDDYRNSHPDDENFRYMHGLDKFLKEDCDYWIEQYHEKRGAES